MPIPAEKDFDGSREHDSGRLRTTIRYLLAVMAVLTLACEIAYIGYAFASEPAALPKGTLIPGIKLTEDYDGPPVAYSFLEIEEGDFNRFFTGIPEAVEITDSVHADFTVLTALASEIPSGFHLIREQEMVTNARFLMFLLIIPMAFALAIGIGNAVVNFFDRSLSAGERLRYVTFGLALSFLPLLFFFPTAVFFFNQAGVYFDNASGDDVSISIESGEPFLLPANSHTRRQIWPGGFLLPRFGQTSGKVRVFAGSAADRLIEEYFIGVKGGRCYVYNIGRRNSYSVSRGAYR